MEGLGALAADVQQLGESRRLEAEAEIGNALAAQLLHEAGVVVQEFLELEQLHFAVDRPGLQGEAGQPLEVVADSAEPDRVGLQVGQQSQGQLGEVPDLGQFTGGRRLQH